MQRKWKFLTKLIICSGIFAACNLTVGFKLWFTDDAFNQFENITNFTGADNVTGFPKHIVPNIIHLVHFDKPNLNFGELITIKSAFLNHHPDRIIIHCNCLQMEGQYWDLVKNIPTLEIKYKERPKDIFGKKISWIQHAIDVARLEVLLEYGGIYIDEDVYVVKSLDKYRKYEFSINWDPGQFIGSHVIVAHKNARFLKVYYELYHDYQPDKLYYNVAELPTVSILSHLPHWLHRVTNPDFGGDISLANMLYRWKSDKWRDFTTIHLFLRHKSRIVYNDYMKKFDTENIKMYNKTFGDMARLVLFGSTDQIQSQI